MYFPEFVRNILKNSLKVKMDFWVQSKSCTVIIMSKKLLIVIYLGWLEILTYEEVFDMGKNRKANHVIPGANAASAQGRGAGFNEEMAGEPLTTMERMNNKKRKKNQ